MEFEQVYDLYFRDVYRYILKLSGSEHVAEGDHQRHILQGTAIHRKIRGSCDMRVWLCQIAKNCYYTYLRKEKHTTPLEELPESVGSADTPRGADRRTGRKPGRYRPFCMTCRSRTGRCSCGGYTPSCLISRSVNCSPSRITGHVSPTTVPET